MDDASAVIVLYGPTASGKTDLALALHERLPVELISVDSAMVYRGLDIGSAKPDAVTLERAPHHLIDIRDPHEVYSAADFRDDALALIEQIHGRGKIPLLVGGTMMYFRALLQGLADMPSADPDVRARLEQQAQSEGWPALHKRLAEVDPQAAARIHCTDPQRIQRALEVYELSGIPMSEWHASQQGDFPYRAIKLALLPPERTILWHRIEQRFHNMLAQGLLDEVQSLVQRYGLQRDLPAMRAVGYRQVLNYLRGDLNYEDMIEKALAATRQLAKRQQTWLNAEKDCTRFMFDETKLLDRALVTIEQGL